MFDPSTVVQLQLGRPEILRATSRDGVDVGLKVCRQGGQTTSSRPMDLSGWPISCMTGRTDGRRGLARIAYVRCMLPAAVGTMVLISEPIDSQVMTVTAKMGYNNSSIRGTWMSIWTP